jgi:hypothetical protein
LGRVSDEKTLKSGTILGRFWDWDETGIGLSLQKIFIVVILNNPEIKLKSCQKSTENWLLWSWFLDSASGQQGFGREKQGFGRIRKD